MPLLEIKVDLARVADALERIAYLLERLVYPPAPAELKAQRATLDDLHMATPEANQRMLDEQQDFAERHGVVPGSDAMRAALQDWEREQRSLYGEDWEAPEDWRSIISFAETGQAAREPAPAGAGSPKHPRPET